MASLDMYGHPGALPGSEAGRIGMLLDLDGAGTLNDIGLAAQIAKGLRVASAEALGALLGRASVIGPLIPEATLRRARKDRKALSREMSERLYEVSRVLDVVGRTYHGDADAIERFLGTSHPLLDGASPLDMARSSSAGAEAVINLVRRADAGFAV